MVTKLGTQFGSDFQKYKNLEDGRSKSEAGFMKFLESQHGSAMTRGERNQRFRSYLYSSVLEHQENRMSKFVSASNRSTDKTPLTIDMLSKSIFSCFLYRYPTEDDMATEAYKRDNEMENVVAIMNMLHDLALGGWNPSAGHNDENQLKLMRLFRSKSTMAWSELLRDAVCGKLELQDQEERSQPFYRVLSEEQHRRVKSVVERLVSWKFWSSPPDSEVDRILSDNKSAVKEWLKSHGLRTGYLMGAPE